MKRDMDLIRLLLLKLEALEGHAGTNYMLSGSDSEMAVEGYDEQQIDHHLHMLAGSDLVRGKTAGGSIIFYDLSWEGRDFLDSVRDPDVWRRTKEGVGKAKGFTLGLLGDVAKAILKGEVARHLGLPIG